MNMSRKNSIVILICTFALAIFGVLMVYSASHVSAVNTYGNSFYFGKKQLIGVIIGTIGLVVTSRVNVKLYKKFYIMAYLIGLVLLALVFVPGLAKSSYGATRWIGIGSFNMQPSEIAKFCLVIFLAGFLCEQDKLSRWKNILLTLSAGGVYCLLIMLEPNMSVTICVGLTLLFMMFVGGLQLKIFGIMSVPLVCLAILLVIIEPYRWNRIIAFINPWQNQLEEGYQLIQSLYAIGSGGLLGVGFLNSRQAHLFLPFSESDFIFSIIAEEFGFLGCCVLMLVFLVLIVTIFKVGINAKDKFSAYLCFGIGAILCIQVVLNIAVVTGSIPPTGLPLPFISAGSTSLLVFMSAMGIVLNVDRQSNKKEI